MKKTFLSNIFFFILFASLSAQFYQPLACSPKDSTIYKTEWTNKLAFSVANAPEEYDEYYEEAYQNRYDYLMESLNEEYFIFDPNLDGYIDRILSEIVLKNATLSNISPQILIGRSSIPNAMSLGDGTFIFNLGLLRRLDNADQLAFVICHEIAHVTLRHLEEKLHRSATFLFDKNRKKKWDEIAKSDDREAAIAALKDIVYGQGRHSRSNESAADSLAFIYLSNTHFDPNGAWQCLSILDRIDKEKYDQMLDLPKLLETPDYPVKQRWLEEEKIMFGGQMTNEEETDWDADSLRTHPNCAQRTTLAKFRLNQDGEVPIDASFSSIDSAYQYWVNIADYEMIKALYDFKNTGAALYHCLKLLQYHPYDPYLHAMVGRCLNQIHQANIDRDFDIQVPPPRSKAEEDWKQLMTMLGRMRKMEFALLAKHYLSLQASKYPNYSLLKIALGESDLRIDKK